MCVIPHELDRACHAIIIQRTFCFDEYFDYIPVIDYKRGTAKHIYFHVIDMEGLCHTCLPQMLDYLQLYIKHRVGDDWKTYVAWKMT